MGNYKIEFKATPIKCLYNSENYKIYACAVNRYAYPQIKVNKYGNITLKGDIQKLNLECEYTVSANEVHDKYGTGYQAVNVRSEKPTTVQSSKTFLQEILTQRQAEILLSAYPDIIDRIINNKLDNIDLDKINGIKKVTFEKIRIKVIENFKFAELIDEFSGIFSFSVIRKLYAQYESVEKIKENLYTEPYKCLCQLGGIGFKTADEILLKASEKSLINFQFNIAESFQRTKACALYILNENENQGSTYMSIESFQKECIKYAPEAKYRLASVINNCDEIIFSKEHNRISKAITYKTEKLIADTLKSAVKIKQIWNINIEKYRQTYDIMLTNEQMCVMKCICKNTVTVLQGFAGSGKTSSVLALMNMLKDNNKTALLLAPTGRAAKVLQSYTSHDASTIDRGLMFRPPNKWGYNSVKRVPHDIVILDETSMADVYLFRHLIEAIDFNRTKLLLIGDNAQIPSVSCGNVLQDILNSNVIPTVCLTKVFRYGKGGINTVATDIRENRLTFENKTGIQIIGEDKGFSYIPVNSEKGIDYIIKMYQKLLSNGVPIKDILVLISQNKGKYGTQAINNKIQAVINPDANQKIVCGNTEYRVGDPVIQCINDYESIIYSDNKNAEDFDTALIPNGSIGIIDKIVNNGIIVDFSDYKIYIPKDKFINIKLAYAISIHKSQGGQAQFVIIFAPDSHAFMLNSNLLYVAVTRTKKKCYLLSDLTTLNRAVRKKENFARQTWLADLLKDN